MGNLLFKVGWRRAYHTAASPETAPLQQERNVDELGIALDQQSYGVARLQFFQGVAQSGQAGDRCSVQCVDHVSGFKRNISVLRAQSLGGDDYTRGNPQVRQISSQIKVEFDSQNA